MEENAKEERILFYLEKHLRYAEAFARDEFERCRAGVTWKLEPRLFGTPDERMFRGEELDVLRKLLETIDEREARILRMRFGLDGCEPLTLKQIADEIDISRERVRQIVDEALTKLNARLNDDRPSQFYRAGESEFIAAANGSPAED